MEKSLYHITKERQEIEALIMSEDGEITEAIDKALKVGEKELPTKAKDYISIMDKWESQEAYAKSMKEFYTNEEKKLKNQRNRLKGYLLNALVTFGIDKLQLDNLRTISIRKSKSVEIDIPASDLPKKLQKIEIKTINKNEIKKMIEAGESFKGVRIVDNENINIK